MVSVKKRKKMIVWGFVAIGMAVIFYFSHQQASESQALSISLATRIVQIISSFFSTELEVGVIHFYLRKGTHFFAYLILGMLVITALGKKMKHIWLALSICILFAISDEIHQIFIPGRSGEVRDVLIDTVGAFIGILLILSLKHVRSR